MRASTAFSADTDPKLAPLPAAKAKTIIAAYKELGYLAFGSNEAQYKAFAIPSDEESPERESAELCVCFIKNCDGKWPTEPAHLLGNPMNPYACVSADRAQGAWHFQPALDR